MTLSMTRGTKETKNNKKTQKKFFFINYYKNIYKLFSLSKNSFKLKIGLKIFFR